jgi:hypothetical protein
MPEKRKQNKIIIVLYEKSLYPETFVNFLDIGNIEIHLVFSEPATIENMKLCSNKYSSYKKRIKTISLNNSFSERIQYNFIIFPYEMYNKAKLFHEFNPDKVVFVECNKHDVEFNGNFRVCNWQLIYEYINTFIKGDAVEKKSKAKDIGPPINESEPSSENFEDNDDSIYESAID